MDFPGGQIVESPSVNAGDMGHARSRKTPQITGATKSGATTTTPWSSGAYSGQEQPPQEAQGLQ